MKIRSNQSRICRILGRGLALAMCAVVFGGASDLPVKNAQVVFRDISKASDMRLWVTINLKVGFIYSSFNDSPGKTGPKGASQVFPAKWTRLDYSDASGQFAFDYDLTEVSRKLEQVFQTRQSTPVGRKTKIVNGRKVELLFHAAQPKNVFALVDGKGICVAKDEESVLQSVNAFLARLEGRKSISPNATEHVRLLMSAERPYAVFNGTGCGILDACLPITGGADMLMRHAVSIEAIQTYSPDFATEHFNVDLDLDSDALAATFAQDWLRAQENVKKTGKGSDPVKWLLTHVKVSSRGHRMMLRWTYPTIRTSKTAGVIDLFGRIAPASK